MKIYVLLSLSFILCCCGDNQKDPPVNKSLYPYTKLNIGLDSLGRPTDNNSIYIPINIINDSKQLLAKLNEEIKKGKSSDTEYEKWKEWWLHYDTNYAKGVSNQLFWLEEPILSDKYSGDDTYRLFTMPSFSNYNIIRITHFRDSIEIWYKEIGKPIIINKKRGNYKYNIVTQKRIILSPQYWDTITTLVGKSMFWTFQEPTIHDEVLDGTEYLFEGHIKEGYKAIRRSNLYIDSKFNLFNYLLKMVTLKAD